MKKITKQIEGDKTMKTTNNVQKSMLKAGVFLISLFFVSVSANSQGLWEKYLLARNSGEIAYASAETISAPVAKPAQNNQAALFTEYLAEAKESTMKVEGWMTENFFFLNQYSSESGNDEPMEVESWMVDENYFRSNSIMPEAIDTALGIEPWMLSNRNWK